MAVNRIAPNIATDHIDAARAFYGEILGMSVGMDHGWIVTFIGSGQASPQISFAIEGGARRRRCRISRSRSITYPRSISEWSWQDTNRNMAPSSNHGGVERFFVRDPFGRLLNILSHI